MPLLWQAVYPRNKTSLERFNQDIYTPEYASGFKILGQTMPASTLIQVSNPWQGAKDVKMSYFISRNGEQAPCRFQWSCHSCRSQKDRMYVFFLHRHARCIGRTQTCSRSIRHQLRV